MTTDTESRVRDLLAAVDPPPPRMTAADLMVTGQRTRRRRRQRQVTGVAAVAVLGIGAVTGAITASGPGAGPDAGPAGTPPRVARACAVERLDLPAGATAGEVNAGSPNGRYLAGFASGSGNAGTPVRWDGTRATAIQLAGIGEAQGVNDSGVVVGEGQAGSRQFAWAYADGTVVELPVPDGYTGAQATGVNAAGLVSGVLFDGNRVAAAVWRGATATAPVRVLDAAGEAMAFGIADDGVVVGRLRDGSAAYRWDASGRGQTLPLPAGAGGGAAHGVRGGWAYGLAAPDDPAVPPTASTAGPQVVDPNVAVVWHLATGEPTTVDGGRVEAITPAGHMTVNHDGGTAAIRAPDGTELALPGVRTGGSPVAKAYAYALSDDGTQAGGSSDSVPVRWSCR
ncbi:hypothetical protein WEI85_10170 [Actinomycetes bacterium KLBMP 9797]